MTYKFSRPVTTYETETNVCRDRTLLLMFCDLPSATAQPRLPLRGRVARTWAEVSHLGVISIIREM